MECLQAVYRFGHSVQTETLCRINYDVPPSTTAFSNDIDLLDVFLNPPAFSDGGPALRTDLTAAQAAGSLFRGLTTQVANEIDTFVNSALRNNVFGLPLDLA